MHTHSNRGNLVLEYVITDNTEGYKYNMNEHSEVTCKIQQDLKSQAAARIGCLWSCRLVFVCIHEERKGKYVVLIR